MSETNIQAVTSVTINDFMTNVFAFLDERCPVGSGNAVSRADVAKAGGLTEENDALISSLINAGFIRGWKIRQGRDGGVCRIGEEPQRTPKSDKFEKDWVAALNKCLNERVSMDPKKPTPRDDIAYALAAMTGEREVLKLPNKISEALSLGLCPGFSSRRGAGIYRTSAATEAEAEAPAVSADATSTDTADSDAADVNTTAQDVSIQEIAAQESNTEVAHVDAAHVENVTNTEVASEPVAELTAESTLESTGDASAEPAAEPKKNRRNKK